MISSTTSNLYKTLLFIILSFLVIDSKAERIATYSSSLACDFADSCEDALLPLLTLTPQDCVSPIEYLSFSGCLDQANPEVSTNCTAVQGPTVWFQIEIDDPNAIKLITQVDAPGFDAVWSIYEGTTCADLNPIVEQDIIDGVEVVYPCSNSDGELNNIFQTPIDINAVTSGIRYWVAITAVGEITDPHFDFYYTSALECLACNGYDAFDANNGNYNASIMQDGEWIEVNNEYPFCQGMDVQVCLDFNYDTSGSGNDWLHGFVPIFGPGWEVSDAILAELSPAPNFEFFEAFGDCAPILNGYDLPNVCTYMEDGVLKLCNSACDATCPCSGGSTDGQALPSGYWLNSDGSSSTCGTFSCSPASFWGSPNGTVVEVNLCFELKTKVFDSLEECEEKKSLQIIVQTFSDAITGCWDDPNPCIVDPSLQGPSWEMVCNVPPIITGMNSEICSNENVNILVQTVDGSATEIQVDAIENPNVDGENSFTFSGGSGFINDHLINTSGNIQIVEYVTYTLNSSNTCAGLQDTIKVTVYPDINIDFNPISICEGDCTVLDYNLSGGSGPNLTYTWSNGEINSTITVCPVIPTTYSLTVSDSQGCTGVGEVEVDLKPPVELFLPESIFICKDDNFDPLNPDYRVCLDFIGGSSPFNVQWFTEPGLVGEASGFAGDCFTINEVASSEFLSIPYTLSAEVFDFNGCVGYAEMEVTVTGSLSTIADVSGVECGDTEATISVTGLDAAGNPVTTFLLYGGCPDNGYGVFIDEFISMSGVVSIPVNLLQFACYTIVAQTETSCQSSIHIEIPLSGGDQIELEGTTEICAGSTATLSINNSSDFVNFEWSNNLGSTSFVSFTPDSTATYTVSATDAEGCISIESITVIVYPEESAFCTNPCLDSQNDFQIVGTAYSDVNGNGVYDTGDAPLGNVMITDNATNFTVFTNPLGQYIMPAVEGTFNLTASNSVGDWVESSINIDNIIVNKPCVEGVDFAFEADTNVPNAQITVTNSITRCDFETKFYITVENLNHESFSGEVSFMFDDEATFFSSDISEYQLNGNAVTFETGAIMPFQQNLYTITLKMPSGSASLPVLDFAIDLTQGAAILDNYTYTEQLKCSYDPNDKRTYPDREGEDNLTLIEETLDYTIRFQNNGNDTAFHVRIVDELDINLDPMSIRFNSSSHPLSACIMDHTLMIDFDDILLVDSATNYPASQGYVNFSIDTKDDLPEGTVINNTADIIFDTNLPIVTNSVLNTVVYDFCTDPVSELPAQICEGEQFLGFTETGTYQNTIVLADGCDSIVIINLTVVPDIYLDEEVITICEGEEFEGLDTAGIYTIESADPVTNCPVIRTINLTVLPLTDDECIVATNSFTKDNIQIYPNPTSHMINIKSEYKITALNLYTTTAKSVFQALNTSINNSEIDLSLYQSGLYLLQVETEKGRWVEKVVKR